MTSQCLNKVKVTGEALIAPKFEFRRGADDVYRFWIGSKRLTEGKGDILPVHIAGNVLQRIDIVPGERYCIEGSLQSTDKFTICKKRKSGIYVSVKHIRRARAEDPDESTIALKGTICKKPLHRQLLNKDESDKRKPREITEVTVEAHRKSGTPDYITVIAWHDNARMLRDDAEVGQAIEVYGRIQSRYYNKTLPFGKMEERVAYEVSAKEVKWT